jgi:hypothetical protein
MRIVRGDEEQFHRDGVVLVDGEPNLSHWRLGDRGTYSMASWEPSPGWLLKFLQTFGSSTAGS